MSKKNKSQKALGMPKTKASRQKMRRWTFAAEMKLEDGQKFSSKLPGMIYGNSQEAHQTAAGLLRQFLSDPTAPQDATVVPIAHETVSPDTVRQFRGMNDQVNLFTKAAFILAEKYRLASTTDKEIIQLVNEAVEEAREHLYPRLREAQAKVAALDAPAVEAIEAERPKRKLGIDAVREILDAPIES